MGEYDMKDLTQFYVRKEHLMGYQVRKELYIKDKVDEQHSSQRNDLKK